MSEMKPDIRAKRMSVSMGHDGTTEMSGGSGRMSQEAAASVGGSGKTVSMSGSSAMDGGKVSKTARTGHTI